MRFQLLYQEHRFELSNGRFVIGRSSDCQLAVDDPRVSRHHAEITVTPDHVTVKDLGSRNGVRVNGQLIEGTYLLSHGDQISVGEQEVTLLQADESSLETRGPAEPTLRFSAFSLLSNLADKAFALGRGAEAERILSGHLKKVLLDAQNGRLVDPETSDQAAHYASRLAASTQKGEWVDFIFALYRELKVLCPATVVDELYSVLRQVNQIDRSNLDGYLRVLDGQLTELGPAERFLLGRIKGLERLAALK